MNRVILALAFLFAAVPLAGPVTTPRAAAGCEDWGTLSEKAENTSLLRKEGSEVEWGWADAGYVFQGGVKTTLNAYVDANMLDLYETMAEEDFWAMVDELVMGNGMYDAAVANDLNPGLALHALGNQWRTNGQTNYNQAFFFEAWNDFNTSSEKYDAARLKFVAAKGGFSNAAGRYDAVVAYLHEYQFYP